jgi:hypothetical protein
MLETVIDKSVVTKGLLSLDNSWCKNYIHCAVPTDDTLYKWSVTVYIGVERPIQNNNFT